MKAVALTAGLTTAGVLAALSLFGATTASVGAKPDCETNPHPRICRTPTPTPTTTPTPTPTPTTTPTPTPPPSSPPGTCTGGITINEGAGRSFFETNGEEYFVHNNNWNDTAGGTSVITACNYNNWYVVSDTPDHSDNSVQTYPNVHRDYNNRALGTITSARFAHNAEKVPGMIWNVAFDVWIGSGFTNELMIWTENWNQRPAGTRLADTTIGGHTYQVWKSGGAATPAGSSPTCRSRPDVRDDAAGLSSPTWPARNWIAGTFTTWQVDYGVEIVDTNSAAQRFNFTDFFIND